MGIDLKTRRPICLLAEVCSRGPIYRFRDWFRALLFTGHWHEGGA